MIKNTMTPAFNETDALGHINNTVVPRWFENARVPIFKIFTPDLDPSDWHLIVVKIEIEYTAQIGYQHDVDITTEVSHVGNSSFVVDQCVYQNGVLCAKGKTVMVHFDYQAQKPASLTDDHKQRLSEV